MPTYTYHCGACGVDFERILKVDDRKQPEQENCPECETKAVQLTISGSFTTIDPYRLGRHKPDTSFTEQIQRIKKHHPLGNL